MKKFIQDYRMWLVVLVALILGGLLVYLFVPKKDSKLQQALNRSEQSQSELRKKNTADSLRSAEVLSGYAKKEKMLYAEIKVLTERLNRLPVRYEQEHQQVGELPDSSAVNYFTQESTGTKLARQQRDSIPIALMPSIHAANQIFIENRERKEAIFYLSLISARKDSLVTTKDSVIAQLQRDVNGLRSDFNKANRIIDQDQEDMEKAIKREKRRRIAGITVIAVETATILGLLIIH